MSTEGNVAIVTGAAQGIGRAIVTCLLSQGYQVGRFFSVSVMVNNFMHIKKGTMTSHLKS
jgi:NADP-dependent 3-hydroxy acid dehydrogenase YdfG